jgi:hypothetical protein
MRKIRLPEEKVAKQIASIVNDVTLDLDEVGVYLARNSPAVSVRRLKLMIETATEERETINDRASHYTILD